MRHFLIFAALLVAPAACGDRSEAAGPQSKGTTPSKDSPEATFVVSLNPQEVNYLDVGMGEFIHYLIQVTIERQPGTPAQGPTRILKMDNNTRVLSGTWSPERCRLISSCNCLSAEWMGAPSENGGVILATISGIEVEDINGSIFIEEMQGKDESGKERYLILSEHVAHISIQPRLFVMPREVELNPGVQSFEVTVGKAFPTSEENGELEPDPACFEQEEQGFTLVNFNFPPDSIENGFLMKRITFIFSPSEGAKLPSKIVLPIEKPQQTFTVPVRTAE